MFKCRGVIPKVHTNKMIHFLVVLDLSCHISHVSLFSIMKIKTFAKLQEVSEVKPTAII